MEAWLWLWVVFVLVLLVLPLGYGWGYRGWGPPYPSGRGSHVRREPGDSRPDVDTATWGALALLVWLAGAIALGWLVVALVA